MLRPISDMTPNSLINLRYLSAMTFFKIAGTDSFRQCVRSQTHMAARVAATVFTLALLTNACAETPRTATNFCRQLALEVPAITQPTATPAEVSQMLDRYKRLAKVAPLAIEEDWKSLTELLTVASRVNRMMPKACKQLSICRIQHKRPLIRQQNGFAKLAVSISQPG